MPTSTNELLQAREMARTLLEGLGLEAYLFEIEPREGQWELRVECAVDDGWQSTTFAIDKQSLLRSQEDIGTHERLLSEWREHLVACKKVLAAD